MWQGTEALLLTATTVHVCGEGLLHNNTCACGGAGYTAIHVCGVGLVTQLYMCVGRGWLHSNTCVGEGLVTQQAYVWRGWLHSYTCVCGGAGYTAIQCGVGLVTQLYMCVEGGWLHGNAHRKMSIH